ncbi:MAG: hypothetical protein LBU32_19630 [Clostridiales bacterium]|jgi:hypothetical protein|nr:hypothetical protein [Clostridiales bacterium]
MLDFRICGADPGFIGMLSIQEGGLHAPFASCTGKTVEILSEDEFSGHVRMKPADFTRKKSCRSFGRTHNPVSRTNIHFSEDPADIRFCLSAPDPTAWPRKS